MTSVLGVRPSAAAAALDVRPLGGFMTLDDQLGPLRAAAVEATDLPMTTTDVVAQPAREVPRLVSRDVGGDPVRVLLVEDHQIYLAGLRALLEGDSGVVVVGEVGSVEAAAAFADATPGVVIVVRQGLLRNPDDEPLRQLSLRGAHVLVLAESESELDLARALRAGVRGYLSRQLTGRQLLDSIRSLSRNEPAFDSLVAQQLVSYVTDQSRGPATARGHRMIDQLTQRQRAVALLVAEGLSNEEIAHRLHVSQATVKSHLGTMMRRLDVRSRTQLAILINRSDEGLA